MTSDRHSVFPVDPFSKNIPDEALRGLVSRHDVSFELGPNQVVRDDGLVRRGWVVDLYGKRSAADAKLPSDQVYHHIHDVLHAVAATLVTEESRGVVHADLERFTGAVHIDPRRGFAEEVRLRIQIEPDTTARNTMIGEADTMWRDELVDRLESLGARSRGGG
jgi:hypothetical protein